MAGKQPQSHGPPPLLLMESGRESNQLLLPVPQFQPDDSLLEAPFLEGEVDSFLGQSPNTKPAAAGPSRPSAVGPASSMETFTMFDRPDERTADPFSSTEHQQYHPPSSTSGYWNAPAANVAPVAPPLQVYTSRAAPPPTVPSHQQVAPPLSQESRAYGADGASQEQLPAYEEVHAHWFHKKTIAGKLQWTPFSLVDSMRLEDVHQMLLRGEAAPGFVATMGGRYDVSVEERTCSAVYWQETAAEVRRCTWFYRAEGETIFVPYDEAFSARLEAEYHAGATTGTWNRRLEFPSGDSVVMHNRDVVVHFAAAADAQLANEWGAVDRDLRVMRPRVVKRGVADVDEIDDGEAARIDHLVFVVHGIGSVCDLRFRDVIECTDGMRLHARSLVETHFCEAAAAGACGRVEYLPVQWHTSLHVGPAGVDRLLKAITLPSISKLRHYTNDTILDVLFYTSPKYCQTIAEAVTQELNRIFALFLARNPSFDRTRVSIAGHSLGSLIVFDILAHQGEAPEAPPPPSPPQDEEAAEEEEVGEGEVDLLAAVLQGMGLEEYGAIFEREQMDLDTLIMCDASDLKDLGVPMGPRKKLLIYIQEHAERKRKPAKKPLQQQQQEKPDAGQQEKLEFGGSSLSTASAAYTMGQGGTGQVAVAYPKLDFNLCAFFALGSPIAVFLTVRGVNEVCEEYRLPTCPGFFNIFHPFDPVAYRIEPMINKSFHLKPVLIPHHKGRKRMHLEIKENMARIGSDIKQKLIETFRSTWHTVAEFTRSHTVGQEEMDAVQKAVMDSAIEDMSKEQDVYAASDTSSAVNEDEVVIGQLNGGGRRIDYVLQERPMESLNDYLFALASHMCYWESEDTILLMLRELYTLQGVTSDRTRPEFPPPAPPSLAQAVLHLQQQPASAQGAPPMSQPQGYAPPSFNPGYAPPNFNPGYAPPPPGPSMAPPASQAAAAGGLVAPPLSGFVRQK